MALGHRRPSAGLMHHADRGSQDAGQASQRLLAAHDLHCRMSRKGDGLDNAVAERFFGSLKRERTAPCHDATRQEARDDVIDDIEMFSGPLEADELYQNAGNKACPIATIRIRPAGPLISAKSTARMPTIVRPSSV
jgi:putative transposase